MLITDVLSNTLHRPFPVPEERWKYCQEWHDVLFCHWMLPVQPMAGMLPYGLQADLYKGNAWITVMIFRVRNMRPSWLPPFPPVSDFVEISVHTYVTGNSIPGIFLMSLEAGKTMSAFFGKSITGLNLRKSEISYGKDHTVRSGNDELGWHLNVRFRPGRCKRIKSELDKWLTERYMLFHEFDGNFYSQVIHHHEWPLMTARIEEFSILYRYEGLVINTPAILYHYSDGVLVPCWGRRSM